jgi:hypothetical protein
LVSAKIKEKSQKNKEGKETRNKEKEYKKTD